MTDLRELVDKTDKKTQAYVFKNPLVVEVEQEPMFLAEEGQSPLLEEGEARVIFTRWLRYSKDDECICELDTVMYISDPLDELLDAYEGALVGGNHIHNNLIEEGE